MTRNVAGWRVQLMALAAGLALVACQSAPNATPTAAGTAPASTPAETTAPSPTAETVDVVALFTDKADDFDSGVLTMNGTVTAGLIQIKMSGNITFSGPDSRTLISTTIGGVQAQSETVQVAGKRYMKTGDGPWLEIPVTSSSGDLASQVGAAARGSLKDEGTEERQGQTVHKLVPGSTSAFDPSSLLSSAAGVEDMHVDLAFYVAEDGTPVQATIAATWTQKVGEQSIAAEMEFDMNFSHLGQSQTIRIPDDVWKVFTSARYHFAIAHPNEWTFFKGKNVDELDAPYYAYVLASRQKTGGGTLNQWAKEEVASLKDFLGGKPVSNEATTLGGATARFLSGTGRSSALKKTVVAYEAVVVKGGFVYFVLWVSEVGSEAADRTLFEQMLGTFAFK